MTIAPTFTAPIGDRLTGDRIRSRQDSQITSSRGPLWGIHGPPDDGGSIWRRFVYEIVADPMSMIVRGAPLSFLRLEGGAFFGEQVYDVGGTSEHIWLLTFQSELGGDKVTRLYDLSPTDFSVQREKIITRNGVGRAVDGDDKILYVGLLRPESGVPGSVRGSVLQYNAETFSQLRDKSLGPYWPTSIAGDKDGLWVSWFNTYETPSSGIREYAGSLSFVANHSLPLADEGHTRATIGGGSTRIYYRTIVSADDATAEWPAGVYLHTIKPRSDPPALDIVRSYGPTVSGYKSPHHVGGI